MLMEAHTLAELLQERVPVVVTMYCEDEGHSMERLLKWQDVEFSAASLRMCDEITARIYPSLGYKHREAVPAIGKVPEPQTLWSFEANPHAHAPPTECYSNTAHGVRNAYWMAFSGAVGLKEEL